MTQDEKVKYFQMAAGLSGIVMDLLTAKILIAQYELVLEKKGDTDLRSVVKLQYEIEQKHKEDEK